MRAADVIEALRATYRPNRGWVTVAEVRVATGFGGRHLPAELLGAADQRIDLFAMNAWPSMGYRRLAFEVKVSRADFRAEVANPHKRRAAELLAHTFTFACPAGLVKPEEITDGCGLVEVDADGHVREVVEPSRREPIDLPVPFIASLLRLAAEQRSVERRCGASGCMRSVRTVRKPDEWAHRFGRGPRVPLCAPCAERWDGAVEAAVARERGRDS